MATTTAPRHKAYSYLRFSTPEQMKGDSFRRQTQLAQDYAARHGLNLDNEVSFRDPGVSAYRGANRDTGALGLFLDAVRSGVIERGSFLLVESLDRISRQSVSKATAALQSICAEGISVVTLFDEKVYDEAAFERDPMAFLMMVVMFMRANEESATKARRVRAAWEAKREAIAAGKPVRLTSKAPQWLRASDGGVGFDLIPERADVVHRIFTMTLDGAGKGSIAEVLNSEGVPVFGHGQHWHSSYIAKILDNRATYGVLVPHTTNPEKRSDRRPLAPIKGYYPAVIDEETFIRAKALKATRTPRRGRHAKRPVQNILGGLAVCPRCGGSVTRVNKNSAKGWVYLVCQRAKTGAGCSVTYVRYDRVEQAIRDQIGAIVGDCPMGEPALDDQIEETENNLEGVETALVHLLEAIERGLEPSQHQAIDERLRVLEEARERLRDELRGLYEYERQFSGQMAWRRAGALLEAVRTDPEDRTKINALMREIFKEVTVDFRSGQLVFHWRHGGETAVMFAWPEAENGGA